MTAEGSWTPATLKVAGVGQCRIVALSMLVLVPAVKTWQVVATEPWVSDAERQVLIAAVLSLATIWLVRRAPPVSGVSKRKQWFVAVGLWPDRASADDHRRRVARGALTFTGLGLAIAATLPLSDSWLRWMAASGAAACLMARTVVEFARHRERTRAGFWISAALVLTCLGTAIALGVRSVPTSLTANRFTELVLVTAVGEEFIFRGCLLALVDRAVPPRTASLVAALSFGAWHLGDAWNSSDGDEAMSRALQIGGTVVVTFVGGLLFTFLRRRSGCLVGPILGHIATNLPGIALRR
jgi:membrane protease YdiL (CAAX protease family)